MNFRTCNELCFQKNLISNCSCYNTHYPSFDHPTACLNFAQINCQGQLYNKVFQQINSFCGHDCPEECESIQYSMSTSTVDFLTESYVNNLLQNTFVAEKYPGIDATTLKKSLVSFDVYYEDLQYTEIIQSPQYTIIDLISSIGGSLGLLLGASLLSLVELVELCIKTLVILCRFSKNDKVTVNKK